jgi:hypothetical protein
MESVSSEEVFTKKEDRPHFEGVNEIMKTLFIRMETAEQRREFEEWLVDLWN